MRRAVLPALVLALAVALPAHAQGAGDVRAELAAIRERIAALDLESATAAIGRLLERPGLTDDEQAEALALRAGAHVAGGSLDGAEADYKRILALRPEFVPDPALTSKKSMERLARVRAAMVGTVHLELDPPDARLFVDEREVTASGSTLRVLAGERRLRAERAGFDTREIPVQAVAGKESLVQLKLVPNARAIVVRTDVAGVEVFVDGARAGETVSGAQGASLLVPDLPIGEHALELRKPCHATESFSARVIVDLADRSPTLLAPVSMRPAASRIALAGADYTGELLVDGSRVTALPATTLTVCPGTRKVEARASGRVVWSGTIDADESDRTLDLSPRPSVVLVGDEWPASWQDFVGTVSLRGRIDARPPADPASPKAWRALAIPADADLAVAVRAGRLPGEASAAWLYAPALDAVADASDPGSLERPRWVRNDLGAALVDAGESVVIATVAPGGAAERAGLVAGDRIVAVGPTEVRRVSEARAALDALPAGASVPIRIASPGAPRAVTVPVGEEPLPFVPDDPVASIVRAAWAAAEGAAGGPRAGAALANLARLLERSGRRAAAVDAWKRAAVLDPSRFSARADYAMAVDLASRGKTAEAVSLLRRLRELSGAGEPAILAAAAADRLADLGVSAR